MYRKQETRRLEIKTKAVDGDR